MLYLSLINFYAAHNFDLQYLNRLYGLHEEMQGLFYLLKNFSKTQLMIDHREYENRSIAGVSFFYDIFYQESPFLPFGVYETATELPSVSEMLRRVVEDRMQGIEGGYVSGGFLGNKVSQMICPVPFYFVSHKLKLKPQDIFRIFLPSDFNRLGANLRSTVANSRTSNTLGGVLLGPFTGQEFAEVIVLKESPCGLSGWSKIYRIVVNRIGISSYSYEEILFLTRSEIENYVTETDNLMLYGTELSINPSSKQPIYLIKRAYDLVNGHDLSIAYLRLKRVSIVDARHICAHAVDTCLRDCEKDTSLV